MHWMHPATPTLPPCSPPADLLRNALFCFIFCPLLFFTPQAMHLSASSLGFTFRSWEVNETFAGSTLPSYFCFLCLFSCSHGVYPLCPSMSCVSDVITLFFYRYRLLTLCFSRNVVVLCFFEWWLSRLCLYPPPSALLTLYLVSQLY